MFHLFEFYKEFDKIKHELPNTCSGTNIIFNSYRITTFAIKNDKMSRGTVMRQYWARQKSCKESAGSATSLAPLQGKNPMVLPFCYMNTLKFRELG